MAAARQDGSRDMRLTGSTGDVLAASTSAAPEEILPTLADGGIYSNDCNQAFSSRLHWDNTFTVKKEPIESPPLWTVEGHGPRAPDCMSSLKGLTEGRWRNSFLHETEVPGPCLSTMPEEILPTPTGRSVCSKDQGTLSTSQKHLEGHWSADFVVKEGCKATEEISADVTCLEVATNPLYCN
ncbi:uncharacterized protein LOC115329286 [Ixodes scapularis]|uniref:uncharacterized protein LOC115329286 n=1 Tax=Ixodes scapularis TaxID=6945 RepID=UPI001A9F8BE6|nr:uncharacterized protein LOC115329286 [Ixodes scapularis]